MCGILFYINNNNSLKEIENIFNCIKYRGPDQTVIELIDNMYFCHHRLSIIDITGGKQPILKIYNNNKYILIANGEIYNYKELTTSKSDCEAIIDAYISNRLAELDGDFAFILYDITNKKIISGRDPIGLCPLYIGYNNENLPIAFSSEMKVLEQIENIKSIEKHPINNIIFYNITNNGLIKFDKISLIELIENEYVDLSGTSEYLNYTYQNAEELIQKSLINAVRKRIYHTERPLAILCSGGIDSIIITSIAISLKIPIHVFNLSLDKGISFDETYFDMFISELKNNNINLEYTKVKFNIEEGLQLIEEIIKLLETYDVNTIRASIPMYFLAKYIKNNTNYKVILSGEGSDELFMGYNYFSRANPIQAEKESLRLIKGLHCFDILRAERCFSSNGLELRVPFLDKDVISNVLQIPGIFRMPYNGLEKYILRSTFKNYCINEKLLFRQKERLSDGIGFSWVPSLINYTCDNNVDQTFEKLEIEKKYYKQIYDKYYHSNVLLPREMPDWAIINNNNNNFLGT